MNIKKYMINVENNRKVVQQEVRIEEGKQPLKKQKMNMELLLFISLPKLVLRIIQVAIATISEMGYMDRFIATGIARNLL